MSILKILSEPYTNPGDDVRLLQYIYRKSVYTGGLSVDPQHATKQMEYCRYYWGQTAGAKMYHFIVAFDWKESAKIISAGYLSTIAYEICEHFASEYQIVFAEHHKLDDYLSGKKEHWHIHFVMNPVNYRTGLRYPQRRKNDIALKYAAEIAANTQIQLVY